MFGWYWLRPRFFDEVCPFTSARTLKRQVAGFATSVAGTFGPRLLRLCALICFVSSGTAVCTRQWPLASFLNETSDAADRRIVLEDLVWGIVSSREFLFNH